VAPAKKKAAPKAKALSKAPAKKEPTDKAAVVAPKPKATRAKKAKAE
jgi:hypothetical protein